MEETRLYMKKITQVSFFVICLLFTNLLTVNLAQAVGSPTPTIDYVKNTVIGVKDTILVSGVSVANSEVLVYIDQTFIGLAELTSDESKKLNFYKFSLKTELIVGEHTVMIIGRDKTSMVLSPPTDEFSFKFQLLPTAPAPTIIFPSGNGIFSNARPVITGLTKSGTQVRLYIDGVLVTQTKVLENNSGTASFYYQPVNDLSSGSHILTALAIDKYNQTSATSSRIEFRIEKPLPAPVLLKSITAKELNRPYIAGVAKNDLAVKVFIDNKLDGSFNVKNHNSGTANFSYQVSRPLTKGQHWVYTTSVDKRGKASGQSNIIKINIGEEKIAVNDIAPIVTPEAEDNEFIEEPVIEEEPTEGTGEIVPTEEKPEAMPDEQTEPIEQTEEKPEAKPTEQTEEKDDIKDIIKNATPTAEVSTGIIDESKTQQSKVKLNLIVFILFLVAVIAWIFWVNRELIKEKNAQPTISPDQEKNPDSEKKV